jgi:hypothetical protein
VFRSRLKCRPAIRFSMRVLAAEVVDLEDLAAVLKALWIS